MPRATDTLEQAEHIGHAGHDGGGDPRLPTRIGITMAILGVLLALTSGQVGGERTDLVKALVEQQHAHAKYQAQDTKHRTALLTLRQLDATSGPEPTPQARDDLDRTARSVNRYLQEATAAREWMESFAPVIQAHLDGQEVYDLAQFIVETAIFLAAIALLLRMRLLWYLCIVLGLLGAGTVGRTWLHVSSELRPAEARVEELGDAYRELRNTGKADAADQAFVDQILARRAP